MERFDLKDKIVLVAGASSGIGAATVERLLAEGARVIAAARRMDRLQALAKDRPGHCLPLQLDVADPDSTSSMVERMPEGWRNIHGAVVCAGHDVGGRARFDQADAETWANIIETNVNGTIRVCRAVIDRMTARGTGHIVTLGSVSGLITYPGGSIYSASKHAVRAFTDGLRKDYGDSDIRVTEILPGLTRTEFAESRWGDGSKAEAFYDKAPGLLEPEDIASAILYAMTAPESVNVSQIVVHPTRV
ncbi:SDR family oxidoreductase [Nisaea acidiphila]|uniref:SDR family oxidoreductase n=1 Tax=Nisaea acidiphila TaxID=1862145 RepID=A0A9J7AZ62_9PROT|nr:SDR family oxidoreductase [Nisaea acidiphila]UUX50733.1 SDR family oxidoreductase [Nisaea acidiphila]